MECCAGGAVGMSGCLLMVISWWLTLWKLTFEEWIWGCCRCDLAGADELVMLAVGVALKGDHQSLVGLLAVVCQPANQISLDCLLHRQAAELNSDTQ